MQESFPLEHGGELFGYTFEQLLDGCGVTDERGAHRETARRYVANGCLYVVRNPVDEVAGVFALHIQHLLVHLFHGHSASV